MPVNITNIIKGVNKRIAKRSAVQNYPAISWVQEKLMKHQDEEQIKMVRLGNLSFYYRYPFEILHTYRELFEQEIYRFQADNQTPLIIDCGANIGLSVLYFKSLYPKATVIAYEPDQSNLDLLNRNIQANDLKNVIIKKEAVWTADEKLYFKSIGSQGSQIADFGINENTVEVNAIRLSTVVDANEIDFLKIDIEGAEFEVMKDCAQSLGQVKNIFVEYHGKASETAKIAEILSILDENEFSVYVKLAADPIKHPYISKRSGGSFDVQLNIFGYRE